jgi:uncharacterized protein involved in response to NO
MPTIKLEEPALAERAAKWHPFGLGFRPFFLLAALAGVMLLALWLWLRTRGFAAAEYYGPIGWHSHEMLFGYAVAVIAGFLLTAVRNWTGQPTLRGAPLATLAAVWVGGRIAPWVAAPPLLVALVDLVFLPLLALSLVRPLWAGADGVNRVFVPLLLAMAAANALVHAQALGLMSSGALRGQNAMLDLVILLLVLVGGRVIPFFTEKAVPGARPRRIRWVETGSMTLLPLLALGHAAGLDGAATGLLLLTIGVLQAIRLTAWHHRGIWRLPILWVLYSGYGWLVLGLLLAGAADLGAFPATLATHALGVGAVGVLTLGMIARVALGHTGRTLQTAPAINLAFVMLNLAAALRVFGPWLWPRGYENWIEMAGSLCVLAFCILCVIFAPILLRPRADGRPD